MEDRIHSSPDYRVRRGEISTYGRALNSAVRLRALIAIVGFLLTILLLLLIYWSAPHHLAPMLMAAVVVLVAVSLWAIYRQIHYHFIEPNLAFRKWLQQVCDGNLEARIGLDEGHQHYKELSFHTGNLATSLQRLSDDMDSLVESQTKKLSEQKRVMELLFKLTADVSNEAEDDMAFETVCQYLAEWFESAKVSCYKVVHEQSRLRCVATSGLDDIPSSSPHIRLHDDTNASVITMEQIPEEITNIASCSEHECSEIWVPFYAGNVTAGVLIVQRESAGLVEHSETQRVLTTVSEQLSLLCSKHLVHRQVLSERLSRDRNELAAEIHDSLAQTLLALRYQTTLLSEKLKSQNDSGTFQDVLKINASIEEANEEVRGLIREYRTPLAEHRYAESLRVVIDQFSQSSGIAVFFQSDDPQIRFTPREESALQRIIGEALNNARKYADASMVRVYVKSKSSGVRSVLIEDDGVGFDQSLLNESSANRSPNSGERIGLTIMQERAVSIGARLTIDSECGEGTRVLVTMPPLIEQKTEFA